VGTVRDFRVP